MDREKMNQGDAPRRLDVKRRSADHRITGLPGNPSQLLLDIINEFRAP